MKFTFENTYVNELDLGKLAAHFSEEVGEPVKIPCFGGLITKPKAALLDKEIVCRPLNEDEPVTIELYPADIVEGTTTRMSIFPKWKAEITIGELKDYIIGAMPISEYVKDRRGYNGRLENNEVAVKKWLNQKPKQKK